MKKLLTLSLALLLLLAACTNITTLPSDTPPHDDTLRPPTTMTFPRPPDDTSPATEPPATEPPITSPPITQPPVTHPPETTPPRPQTPPSSPTPPRSDFMRGVWVTTAWDLDFPARRRMTAAELQAQIDQMADNMARWEITDIFFQVRPMGDAFYPSAYFPWSAALSGTQGVAPDGNFDVLQAWITAAHSRGMRLHAWVNPYRLGAPPNANSIIATQNPDLVVTHRNALYLCPGNPASLDLILSGIEEILLNYNVDGIHFDDRFYPLINAGDTFNDQRSFERYGNGMELGDWRRENINKLIRRTHALSRYHGVTFGVSPFAIWQNSSSDPRGSNTSGGESYNMMFADTLRWVQNGYIDYIAPQIYWHSGHPQACWDAVLDWWVQITRDTSVYLYIGIAVYRQFDANRFPQWQQGNTLAMQEYETRNNPNADGVIFFRYEHMVMWMD